MDHIDITQRMKNYIHNWEKQSDPRATFLSCYLLMTENMLTAIEAHKFNDSGWVFSLLNRFAAYYFNALEAYEQKITEAPPVWIKVHDSTLKRGTHALQDLLLGINAHINYDLVLTLVDMLESEWMHLNPSEREQRQNDHNFVNQIIYETIDSVQDQILENLVPEMDIVDRLLGGMDEWMISELIGHWRDDVWGQAVDLIETIDPDDREQKRTEIENRTQSRASLILLVDGKMNPLGIL